MRILLLNKFELTRPMLFNLCSGKFQGPDNATSPGISSSQSNVSGDGRSTRSLRKRSGDDNATTITAEYVGASMQKNVKQQPSTGKDKKKKRQSAKATTASSTKQSTKRQVSIPAISPVSQSPVGRQLFFSLSPKMEAETNPLPEIEGTAEEKLTASLDALKMINQAESNSFYRSGTHFASNLKTILKFLCASIESKGGHGGKQGEPAALYVCGVPGIGKTSGVKWCCTKAIEETTNNSDYEGPTPTVVHINAGHMSSASKPEGTLLKELARALGMKAPEIQKKTNILKHIKAKHMMLVVVDEIDLLVSGSSQALEGRRPGTEGVIQTLLDYAQDETMPIALIGISNSASNNKYHRLNEIGKVRSASRKLLQQSTTPSTHIFTFLSFYSLRIPSLSSRTPKTISSELFKLGLEAKSWLPVLWNSSPRKSSRTLAMHVRLWK
jgi:hypothetical protein